MDWFVNFLPSLPLASAHPPRFHFRSLDRTNVVQSALAKWVLNNQLRQIGVLSVKESVEEHPAFLNLFRNSQSLFSVRSQRHSS